MSCAAVCGLLNSRLINWWYRQLFNDVNIKPRDLVTIPIPPTWNDWQSTLDHLVNEIERLFLKAGKSRTDHERTVIERQIEATDREIDRLVYELYRLNEEEIRLVEEATA
jgi:hypothetical protein